MALTLHDEFERRCGKFDERLYRHILELALDDQRQYLSLSESEWKQVMDPVGFPPNSKEIERLTDIREHLLEAMAIVANIVRRHKMN